MRKIALCVIAATLIALAAGCCENDTLAAYGDTWGVDLSGGTVLSEENSHGGFHGDGAALYVVQFEDDTMGAALAENEQWKALPLSANLNTFVYQPYDSEVSIPAISHGYYYFYDRQAESGAEQDDDLLLRRASFNFTLAIYDTDTQRLYLLEYDT